MIVASGVTLACGPILIHIVRRARRTSEQFWSKPREVREEIIRSRGLDLWFMLSVDRLQGESQVLGRFLFAIALLAWFCALAFMAFALFEGLR